MDNKLDKKYELFRVSQALVNMIEDIETITKFSIDNDGAGLDHLAELATAYANVQEDMSILLHNLNEKINHKRHDDYYKYADTCSICSEICRLAVEIDPMEYVER